MVSSKNADHAYFVYHVNPWFARGGYSNNGTESGMVSFGRNNGSVDEYLGFRVVLRTIFQISLR